MNIHTFKARQITPASRDHSYWVVTLHPLKDGERKDAERFESGEECLDWLHTAVCQDHADIFAIDCLNPIEGWSHDVTEELQEKLWARVRDTFDPTSDQLPDFLYEVADVRQLSSELFEDARHGDEARLMWAE